MKKLLLAQMTLFCSIVSFAQEKEYTNKEDRFAINYYPNWEVVEKKYNTLSLFAPPEGPNDKQAETLGIDIHDSQGMSLDEYYQTFVTYGGLEELSSYEKLSEGEETINGLKSKWFECKYKDRGIFVTNLIYLIAKGDKIFMLTSFSSTEKYPKYKDNFLGMIKSFEAM
ncbi:MAG: hypothetical protein RIG62_12000 [Cyclobacteriaceae bacterium]